MDGNDNSSQNPDNIITEVLESPKAEKIGKLTDALERFDNVSNTKYQNVDEQGRVLGIIDETIYPILLEFAKPGKDISLIQGLSSNNWTKIETTAVSDTEPEGDFILMSTIYISKRESPQRGTINRAVKDVMTSYWVKVFTNKRTGETSWRMERESGKDINKEKIR
jgi:hypothetical protein